MPVGTYSGPNVSTADGVATVYAYDFQILADADLKITVDGVVQVHGVDVTVDGVGAVTGGNVTFLIAAPASGAQVVRSRVRPYKRDTDYQRNGSFDEATVDQDFDSAEMQIQQLAAASTRAIKAPESVSEEQVITDDDWAARAGSLLGYDASKKLRLLAAATGTSLVDLAASTGGSLVGISRSETGAEVRSVADKLLDVVSAFDYYTEAEIADVRARTALVDISAAEQDAINAVAGKLCALYHPAGIYRHDTTLVFKNGCSYVAEWGSEATEFKYTGAGDQAQINNPINSSTSARISFDGFWFHYVTPVAGKACLADVGSSLLSIRRCGFYNGMIGLILDQSELVDVELCDFELPNNASAIGAWIVNGAQHSAGAAEFWTNRIAFRANQFNGYAVGIGVADDGGSVHVFEDNNYNALDKHIRACAVRPLIVRGGESEGAATTHIDFQTTKVDGSAGYASQVGKIEGVLFACNTGVYPITVGAAAVNELIAEANVLSTTAGVGLVNGPNNVARLLRAEGNTQIGAGATYQQINNYIESTAVGLTLTASGTAFALGNGTLTCLMSRRGQEVTMRVTLTFGSTTTAGTGTYSLTLPNAWAAIADNTATAVARVFDNGTGYYGTLMRIYSGASECTGYAMDGSGNNWGAAYPIAVPAAGDSVEFDITYTTANKLN